MQAKMIINAQQELLHDIPSGWRILSASLVVYNNRKYTTLILYEKYTREEFDDCWKSMNFYYDNQHGRQTIDGWVLFEKDGEQCDDWIERMETNKYEMWVFVNKPKPISRS